jgi:hypothetical protein
LAKDADVDALRWLGKVAGTLPWPHENIPA